MGALIFSVLVLALRGFGIISTNLCMIMVFSSIAWIYIGAGLYFGFGFLKWFYHDFLHWHQPDSSPKWNDGLSEHATCKHCGKDIMEDSQGNWFT